MFMRWEFGRGEAGREDGPASEWLVVRLAYRLSLEGGFAMKDTTGSPSYQGWGCGSRGGKVWIVLKFETLLF